MKVPISSSGFSNNVNSKLTPSQDCNGEKLTKTQTQKMASRKATVTCTIDSVSNEALSLLMSVPNTFLMPISLALNPALAVDRLM